MSRVIAPSYISLYLSLQKRAEELGYALTVHGSVTRDLDVVAIPWTAEAVETEVLLAEMIKHCGGHLHSRDWMMPRAHGRITWAIHFGDGPYVDISIMLRLDKEGKIIEIDETALRAKLIALGVETKTVEIIWQKRHTAEKA